jgi:hypothetical protein
LVQEAVHISIYLTNLSEQLRETYNKWLANIFHCPSS